MLFRIPLIPVTAALALVACNTQPAEEPVPPDTDASAVPTPAATESVSILRPEIAAQASAAQDELLPDLEVTIGFPAGGTNLDDAAVAALEALLESDQVALGGPINLRAHSDSAGGDSVNLDASEARGLAVAQWLIENGVDEDRITVIAFGEQNPVAPNAKRDGTPDEDGRAINRRVEVEVPTLTLTVSTNDEEGTAPPGTASTEAGD